MADIASILRDGQNVSMPALRSWLAGLAGTLSTGTVSALVGTRTYATQAALFADLVPADGLFALVLFDSDPLKNGLYQKSGATGAGSWTGPSDLFASAAEAAVTPIVDEANNALTSIRGFADAFAVDSKIGRASNPTASSDAANGAYVYANPVPATGWVAVLKVYGGSVGGTITPGIYSKTGDDFARVKAGSPLTVLPSQLNSYVIASGDLDFEEGLYLGFHADVAGAFAYNATQPGDDGGWYFGTNPTAFTDSAPTTSNARLEVRFELRLLDSGLISSARPLAIVADGNSLTAGTGGATPWATQLASEWGVTITNKGVSGQNIQQMIDDFDTDIAPLAVQAGYRTVLVIDGEPYNWLRMQSYPTEAAAVTAAVDKLAEYAALGRTAGFDMIAIVNSAAHNTATDAASEGNWNRTTTKAAVNAELAARWPDFADVLVDIGSAPQLADYTNGTYYQIDGIHYTTAGQTVVKNRVRAALAGYR